MACFPPVRRFCSTTLGSSALRGVWAESTTQTILSCPSPPPRRLHVSRAAPVLTSYVDRKPFPQSPSRKLPRPSASQLEEPFFSLPVSEERPVRFALRPGRHILGFGYPLDVRLSPPSLKGLFQPSTLLGFTL